MSCDPAASPRVYARDSRHPSTARHASDPRTMSCGKLGPPLDDELLLLSGLGWFVAEQGLHFQILMEAEFSPLAAVTALLVAAERGIEIKTIIDRDPAGPDLTRDVAGLFEVLSRHIAS